MESQAFTFGRCLDGKRLDSGIAAPHWDRFGLL